MLVTRYEGRVYALAYRILRQAQDAEDVTQETFLSALEHINDFREEASFYTWLMRIATHASFKVLRKRKGLETVSFRDMTVPKEDSGAIPLPDFIADWRDTPDKLLEREETREVLEKALEELDEKYRMVFLLRDVEGLSVSETAEVLGISEANVKVRLLRARLQLRERLTKIFGDETKRVLSPSKGAG
jgi:RNA polymerase sigma-70 factor (ECF subfamily)